MKIIHIIIASLLFFSFEANAGFAEDAKEDYIKFYKHATMDPDNNHEDFCGYMFDISNKMSNLTGFKEDCYGNVCKSVVNVYKKNEDGDYRQKYGFRILYKNDHFEILGIDLYPEDIMDYKNRAKRIERTRVYVLIDGKPNVKRSNNSLRAIEVVGTEVPKNKSYLKVTGCRVDEFKIINNKSKYK